MWGSNITRRAAAKINRAIQQSNNTAGGTGAPLQKDRLFLAKTTVAHESGETEDVDIYIGQKGAESPSGQTVEAYNRHSDLDADEWIHIKWIGSGWEIITKSADTIEDTSSGSGGCCDGKIFARSSGSIPIGGAMAFPKIIVRVIGSGSNGVVLEYDGAGTWSSDSFNVTCGGSTVSMHYELTAADDSVAEVDGTTGVTLVRVDGSANNFGTWRNSTQCWRPNVPTRLYIAEPGDACGDSEAPCEICISPGAQDCTAYSAISGYTGFPGVDGGLVGYGTIRCSGSEDIANPSRACDGPPFLGGTECTFLSSIDAAVLPGEDYQLFVYLDAGPTTFEVAYAVATTTTSTAYSGSSGYLPIAQIFDPVPIVGDPGCPSWTAQAF